jgi:hypothetical protein
LNAITIDAMVDEFFTRVDQVSLQDAQSRTKAHEFNEPVRPRWRPKTANGNGVDPA